MLPKSMPKLGTDKVAEKGFENVHNKIRNSSVGDSELLQNACFTLTTFFFHAYKG